MSTEYYPTRYISWDVFTKAVLPEPLCWVTAPANNENSQCLTDGRSYLHAKRARAGIGEAVGGTYFERYGGNEHANILLLVGRFFECRFVDEQGAAVTKEGDQDWDDREAIEAARQARGRKIP